MDRWQFGPYRVEALLGRGGMGEVYRAYDASQDRIVALKLLAKQFATDEQFQERFRRESRAAARLREPHVIPIHRYGEIDGRLFIDMRLVEGDSLAVVLARTGPMSPLRAALVVEQVASALDAAHADGLVHRDVKPSNVLLTRSTGGHDFVYLVDFGISRTLKRPRGTSLTEAGAMIGTPDYMAPERFVDGSIDHQSDVYALACLMYECLTAQPPFPAADLPSLIYAHVNTPPPRPSTVLPGLSESVDAVVAVGMAKDPTVRYSSAGELAAALRTALLPGTVVDRPATVTPPHKPSSVSSLAPESDPVASASKPVAAAGAAPTATPSPRSSLTTVLARRHERLGKHRWIVGLVVAGVVLLAATGTILGTVWRSAPGGESQATAHAPNATMSTVETIQVGSKPEGVAVTPDGKNAYVTNVGSKDISVIDTNTNKVTTRIQVQAGPPQYIAIAPDGQHAYATIYDPDDTRVHSVAVIDTTAKKVTETITVGQRPYGLAVTPNSSEIYVADHDSKAISVIAATNNSVVATIDVKPNPHWIAFSPDGRTAYVANHESNVMSVINTATRTVTSDAVRTGKSPHGVAVSHDGRRIGVADYDANAVTVLDAFTRVPVAADVPVEVHPRCVAYSPDDRSAYIVNEGSNTLSVIDTRTNRTTRKIDVGHSPTAAAVSPDGRHVYVVNQGSDTVSVVSVAP